LEGLRGGCFRVLVTEGIEEDLEKEVTEGSAPIGVEVAESTSTKMEVVQMTLTRKLLRQP
jgi:hypothetical protein